MYRLAVGLIDEWKIEEERELLGRSWWHIWQLALSGEAKLVVGMYHKLQSDARLQVFFVKGHAC